MDEDDEVLLTYLAKEERLQRAIKKKREFRIQLAMKKKYDFQINWLIKGIIEDLLINVTKCDK